MEAALYKTVNRPAAARPSPAAAPVRAAPAGTVQLRDQHRRGPAPAKQVRAAPAGTVQLRSTMRVSSPRDPAEREAEATAAKIMRMAESPYIARFAGSIAHMQRRAAALVARRADGSPAAGGDIAAGIAASGSGAPLPAGVRRFMEPRFGADFSSVRIHTGERSAQLNRQVSAQAFTVGNQIFFGRDRFQPDTYEGRELIAHELTHTIQQGAVQQGGSVHHHEDASVTQKTSPHVQRLGISDALDYFADAANAIPGYRMFTILLGVNPINMSRVDRSAANILRAIVEFLPGGNLITRALDVYGVFDRVGAWVEQQLQTLGISGSMIRDALNRFLDSLSWRDIFRLGSVWDRAKRIFTDPIGRIISFARSLFGAILRFIKDAILRPLAGLASRTRGWDLLCAVLGQNPITGEAVPRRAETLIGGFMKLIGQEEIWENIKRGNAIARAWAWFQGALSGLMGFVRQIPQLFLQALAALEIADIVLLPRAFARVAGVFGTFIGDFLSWGGNTVWNLLEIIFSVVAPGVMVYLQRARGAFRTILRDPIGFVHNLVRAGMQGFRQFAGNFLTHLRASLIGWLTGAMSGAGIYIPQGLTLREIIKFVLSVLGLTWQNIRQKLVRAIGETAVRVLETTFDIVVTLVTQGPAAAWEKIQESLSNLRDMVMGQIMTFVRDRVVTAAVTRLLSMLSPAGAFIQAIIAIYNTVMFFVERLRQIAQVAMSFIDSISAIASGVIAAAANRVEQTMAGLLTLVISFLARIAGLGRVSDAVTNVVNRVRQPIDRALDRVVEWIVAAARRLGRFLAQAGLPNAPEQRVRLAARDAVTAAQRMSGTVTRPLLEPLLSVIRLRYGLRELQAFERGGTWWVRAVINPTHEENTGSLINPNDASQVRGMLDLYRGIYLQDKVADYDALSEERLQEQLIREQDFADGVYTILGITRGTAPTVTEEQRQAAAATVIAQVRQAQTIRDVRPWWNSTRRANLFFTLLQRFINARTELQEELRTKRVRQLSGFTFTDLPFISTTKRPARAARYAFATVVATASGTRAARAVSQKVVGKVFVYLFRGSDLAALGAADIRYLAGQSAMAPHYRYSTADKEVTFTGSIPAEHRVGEVIARDNDSEGGVAGQAKQIATSRASSGGGLLPWSES